MKSLRVEKFKSLKVQRTPILTLLPIGVFVAIYILSSSILYSASASSGIRSALSGKIAFEARQGDNWQIYLANSDGSGVMRLTETKAENRAPSWSPDGTRIAFVSERDGNKEIYLMNGDGSGVVNLTHHMAQDFSPVWSPDGERIAFVSD